MKSIKQLADDVRGGHTSSVALVQDALDKAAKSIELNIFLEIFKEQALEQAKNIDARVAKGDKLGKLAGVPFAAKDNFLYAYGKTTAAADILSNFSSPITATSLQKVLDEDAILIGKVNLDAFAHGGSTENSFYGPTKNPHNTTKVPGGSSGGSAAAVAAGIVPFALGSDTGGSIRQPASFCGVVGYKPTYGLVSRYGVVAMASSTDCIGPISSSATDASYLMEILRGRDPLDGTTLDSSQIICQITDAKNLKIGVIKEYTQGLDKDVADAFDASIKVLKAAGHTITEISIPSSALSLPCYYVLVPAEVSSNLSRYDGIRYGNLDETAGSLEQAYLGTRSKGFMPENQRRLMIGTYVLSSGYFDAYYKKAQRLRTRLIREYETALEGVDILIGPTSPTSAFDIGGRVDDPVKMYQTDIMTVGANLTGMPAISIPLKSKTMPVGLQIISEQRKDGLVLSAAAQIEEDLCQ